MVEHDLIPDQVLCSPARRTAETWAHISPAFGGFVPVEFEPGLYLSSTTAIVALIQSQPIEYGTVLLVGHNPGIEQAAIGLCGAGDARMLHEMKTKYPTCALAEITFESQIWGEIDWGEGTLQRFVRPRDL